MGEERGEGKRVMSSSNLVSVLVGSYKSILMELNDSYLRVSFPFPAVWINSFVFICQELCLYHIFFAIFLLHGFPLVTKDHTNCSDKRVYTSGFYTMSMWHSQLFQPPSKSSRNCSQYTNYYWDDLNWSTTTNSFDLVFQVKVNGVWPEGLSSCPVTQNVNKFRKTLLSVGFLTRVIIIIMIIITVGYDIFFMLERPWDLRPINFLPVVFSRMGLSDFHSKALGK